MTSLTSKLRSFAHHLLAERGVGDEPPRPQHYDERVRKAAATIADRVGGGRDGVYWRLRKDTYYSTIRAQKRESYRDRPA